MTTISHCIDIVTRGFRVRAIDLRSNRQSRVISTPRQVVYWLAREATYASFAEIARALRRSDHTTVCHGIRNIEAMREADPVFRATTDALLAKAHAGRICENPKCERVIPLTNERHCSQQCAEEHKRDIAAAILTEKKICGNCHEPFGSWDGERPQSFQRRKTCSPECAHTLRSKSQRKGPQAPRQRALPKGVDDITSIAPQYIANADEIRRAEAAYARSRENYATWTDEERRSYAHG